MTAVIMDGQALAADLVDQTRDRAARFAIEQGREPCLATVLVGDDPASQTYVAMKASRCQAAGIASRRLELGAPTTTPELVGVLAGLSADPEVDGILLQHPVPTHVDERAAFDAIIPAKDVDGVTRSSFAAMALGQPGFQSCTPGGILRLLDSYGVALRGSRAVVVGRSAILGKPLGMLLLARELPSRSATRTLVICLTGWRRPISSSLRLAARSSSGAPGSNRAQR